MTPALAEGIRIVLEEAGYSVTVHQDGRAALVDLSRSPAPCLVLLDLKLSGMDGFWFRQNQMHDPFLSTIPVVVISGASKTEPEARTLDVAAKEIVHP